MFSQIKNLFFILVIALAFGCLLPYSLFSQTRIVDKNRGSHYETKKGYMDGNLVATVYYNFGEIADWLNDPSRSGVWPKGTNHTYVDGVAVIVQAETQDPQGNIIHPLETNYYEYTRHDPTGVTYGWWPLPGYANRFQNSVAQSNDPNTWPPHWPDEPSDWDGKWNGFFGKGVQNADLESYFVFDDNEDREYILQNHFYPDADDTTRGGLGMQVHGRGFQWSQVLAEDVIFWHYEITNMGTTDYGKSLFAQYVDWGIGGHDNSANNAGDYRLDLNLSYSWSTVPFGSPGNWSPVGYAGYAFLESPGVSDDFIDNDRDGMVDEMRDNAAATWPRYPQYKGPIYEASSPYAAKLQAMYNVPPVQPGGVKAAFIATHDTSLFLKFFNYQTLDDVPAIRAKMWWPGDENGNWDPEFDDVGSDGVGPLDANYTGPEADSTQGNLRPDQGEPNFGILDKDESDQLGLTGFIIAAVHTYDLNNDERNWQAFTALPPPHDQTLVPPNLGNWFSSYPFHMNGRNTYTTTTGQIQQTGETQRFSMALIFGMNADDLFRRKNTVQKIYNASYRFAKPPDKPIVKAIAGDHKVTLYWDSRAEKTFDAFYQKYNFEGYRVYRSTEPNFLEDKIITDAYGAPTFRVPIAQFDLIDGITGLHPIGVNGAYFYLGDDSGLQHSFIDTTVQNGQTYYYAVCAYDQGYTTTTVNGQFEGIPPSETTSIIKVDINGQVKTDINTAVVTPRAPSAGYVAPSSTMDSISGPGTGSVSLSLLDPDSLRNHHYQLSFVDSTAYHNNPHPSYRLVDRTSGDTLIGLTRLSSSSEQTTITNGFVLNIMNDEAITIDQKKSGWVKGSSNYVPVLGFDASHVGAFGGRRVIYPADFEITFTGKFQGDTSLSTSSFVPVGIPSNIVVKNTTENIDHVRFVFYDTNNDSLFDAGDVIYIMVGDSAGKQATSFSSGQPTWSVTLVQDTTIPPAQQQPPQPGDKIRITTTKPFRTGEFFDFTTQPPSFNESKAKSDMANIAVVPNPYVGAASWEPQTTSVGRGDRLVYFIHLPKDCTIRIYTISGHLVQTLEHHSTLDDGQEPWNLVSRDGMDIAFGVYVFHVDAPGVGTTIGKFAVIK